MSPVTHGLVGWLVAQPAQTRKERVYITVAALVPDIDGLTLLFGVDAYREWHHTFGHNVYFGLVTALAIFALTRSWRGSLLGLASFHLHLFTDLLGSGTGWAIRYLWPTSDWEILFSPPLQWELNSWQNFLITVLCLVSVAYIGLKKRRTIVETVSVEVDRKVVEVLKRRLRRPG